jgi:chromosome segregation ATPase
MTELAQAVADIRFLALRFKGLLAAADSLGELGSLENAIAEAQARLDAKRAEIDAAQADHEKVLSDAAAAAEAVKAQAAADAQKIRDDAAAELAGAREVAAELARQGAAQAEELVSKAKAEVAIHSDRAASLTLEVAHLDDMVRAGNARCEAVAAKLSELQAEQARVEGIIAEAKAKLGVIGQAG